MKSVTLTFAVLVLGIFSAPSFGQQPTPTPKPDEETVRITTSLIQVDAVVTDKNGNPVTDLKAEDFKIYQDGKLQKVTNLSYVNSQTSEKMTILAQKEKGDKKAIAPPPSNVRSRSGRIITFVLDDGNCLSTFGGMNMMRDSMKHFIDDQMQPDDRVAIYRTTAGVSLLQVYTSNKEILRKKIEKISLVSPYACSSAFEALSNDSTGKGDKEFGSQRDTDFKTAVNKVERENKVMGTLGLLNFVVDRLTSVPQRKIVFLISEGVIGGDSKVTDVMRDVAEKAARASVVINTISTKGVTIPGMIEAGDDPKPKNTTTASDSRRKEENQLNEGLAYIAGATGGQFVHDTNSLAPAIQKVVDRQTSYYLIGYEPDDDTFKGKKFHNIEIKVERPDTKVSSRDGFYGHTESVERPVYKTTDSAMYQAMDSPLQETGMDVQLTVLQGNSAGTGSFIRPLFHLKGEDITFKDDKDGTKLFVIDVVGITLDEKGKLADEFSRTYSTRIPAAAVPLAMQNGLDFSADMPIKKPGIYSFRLAVRDNPSKRLASIGDYVEVPDINKKDLFVAGLITTTADAQNGAVLTKTRPPESAFSLVPSLSVPSIRQYARGSRLYYAYTVYNAKIDTSNASPELSRKVRLYHNGKLISDVPEVQEMRAVPADPLRIDRFGNIDIAADVETGEYALQIIVTDKISKRTSSQWIDFEVVN